MKLLKSKIILSALMLSLLPVSGIAKVEKKDKPISTKETRLEAITKYSKIISVLEKYNLEGLSLEELIDKSLVGLMSNIDAHSSFMSKDEYKSMMEHTDGEFGGLGITISKKDGVLTIIAPIEGTPADKAGLKSKDIILKIDDASTLGMSINDSVKLMKGKPKTDVTLTIVRKGESKPLKIKIVRDIIKVQSVYSKVYKEKIVYIRVTSFDSKVTRDVSKLIKKYEGNEKIEGIVLDLRNNPGGLLNEAIGLSDIFIDEGVIVSQKGRNPEDSQYHNASLKNTLTKKPLVVLVNSGSASASEIVSGAIQDSKRGIIVGEKTFGKGSVQVILPLDEGEGLKMTIARYYLPSGRTIQAVGITPDVLVKQGSIKEVENEFIIKEADLKQHLEGELAKIDKSEGKKVKKKIDSKKIITDKDLKEDIQLKEGIDILKSLIIMEAKYNSKNKDILKASK